MTSSLIQTADQEILKRSNFQPRFDAEGTIVGITELKVETDTRLGVQTMRSLFGETQPGDDTQRADGWTQKQRRLISTPAPHACHYLQPSRKWDAKLGDFRQSVLIKLPLEVVWTLFELLFDGQFSVEVRDLHFEGEEVMPASTEHNTNAPDNAPGRIFYARASVRITLHLPGVAARTYDGLGVAYGELPLERSGNVFAINSARRTAEKGAVADAKREALANIGPVFRRAFEDGDEMIEYFERLIVDELQERNRPRVHASSCASSTPAPRTGSVAPRRSKAPGAAESAATPAASDAVLVSADGTSHAVAPEELAQAFLDEAVARCESVDDLDALIGANEAALAAHMSDPMPVEDLRQALASEAAAAPAEGDTTPTAVGPEPDGIPDFAAPAAPEPDSGQPSSAAEAQISTADKSGAAILKEICALFDAARSTADIDRIVENNGAAIIKLGDKQRKQLISHKQDRTTALA